MQRDGYGAVKLSIVQDPETLNCHVPYMCRYMHT